MIRLLTAVFLFASFHAVAEVTLTDINNNEVADADDVMGNFNALKDGVEANATAIDALPTPPTDCTTDQIIQWNGSAWVCSTPQVITDNVFSDGLHVVFCPGGKKVTGGGCDIDGRDCTSTESRPLSNRHGWMCGAYGGGGFCEVNIAQAICQ